MVNSDNKAYFFLMSNEALKPTSVPAISARLIATRHALGLSQVELCRRTGIATNTYNMWEKGNGRPELDKAFLLCETFGLTLDWIYRGDATGLPYGIASKALKDAS